MIRQPTYESIIWRVLSMLQKNEGSLKALKMSLGIGEDQTYTRRNKQGNVIKNTDEIVTVAEEFYRDLYSISDNKTDIQRGSNSGNVNIPPVMIKEVMKAFK